MSRLTTPDAVERQPVTARGVADDEGRSGRNRRHERWFRLSATATLARSTTAAAASDVPGGTLCENRRDAAAGLSTRRTSDEGAHDGAGVPALRRGRRRRDLAAVRARRRRPERVRGGAARDRGRARPPAPPD